MKILIFIFLFFSSNLYAEGLVNKSASLALKSLMTMVSMFDDIEKDMGENWEVAWRLDGFNERQETC